MYVCMYVRYQQPLVQSLHTNIYCVSQSISLRYFANHTQHACVSMWVVYVCDVYTFNSMWCAFGCFYHVLLPHAHTPHFHFLFVLMAKGNQNRCHFKLLEFSFTWLHGRKRGLKWILVFSAICLFSCFWWRFWIRFSKILKYQEKFHIHSSKYTSNASKFRKTLTWFQTRNNCY